MQVGLPVAAPAQAATQVLQLAPPLAAGAICGLPILSLFDDVLAKATAAQGDQPPTPAAQAVSQPVDPAIPGAPAIAMPQLLPLPPPDPSDGSTSSVRPAATVVRKGESTSRQRTTQARPLLPAELSPTPPIQSVPPDAPPAGPCAPPDPLPMARPHLAAIGKAAPSTEKPADNVPSPPSAHAQADLQSAQPDAKAPAGPDPVAAAPTAQPTHSSSPVATELSVPLLQVDRQPSSANAPSSSPAPASPKPAVASPAAQMAPVLVSMAHAPDGAQRLTLRLDPPELGRVEIRVDRPPEAPTRVEITVERPETLTLLLRDQPQLQHALDQAGLPPDGRSVTIHVAAAEPGAQLDGRHTPGPGTGSPGTGDHSHSAFRQGDEPSRGAFAGRDDTETDFAPVAAPGWVRAGLDITA